MEEAPEVDPDDVAAHGGDDSQSEHLVRLAGHRVRQTSLHNCLGEGVGTLHIRQRPRRRKEGCIAETGAVGGQSRSLAGVGFRHRVVVVDWKVAGRMMIVDWKVVGRMVVGLKVCHKKVAGLKAHHVEVVGGLEIGRMNVQAFRMIEREDCFGWHRGVAEVEVEDYTRYGLNHRVGRT